MANDAVAAWNNASQAALDAAKAQQGYWQTELANAEKLASIGQQLRDYVNGLQTGSLSALTPAQQLAVAQQDFAATLAAAQAGDQTAASRLQGSASGYLEQARQFNPGDYAAIFAQVTGAISGTAGAYISDAQRLQTTAQAQLSALTLTSAATQATATATTVAAQISTENAAKLDTLKDIAAGILTQATLDKAAADARLTEEKATQARLEADRVVWQGNLLAAQQSARDSLAGLPAAISGQTVALVAEIAALRQQVQQLQAAQASGTGALAQTVMESGASTAAIVAGAITSVSALKPVPVV